MAEVKSLVIDVNCGADKPYNQYAAYLAALMAKQILKIPTVTIFYGPQGIGMVKKGELAKFAITDSVKELIAGQLEGVSASDLPDNLALMARFVKDKLGVTIVSCGTFHVIDGFAKTIDDTSNIEDFVIPITLPQVAAGLQTVDMMLSY